LSSFKKHFQLKFELKNNPTSFKWFAGKENYFKKDFKYILKNEFLIPEKLVYTLASLFAKNMKQGNNFSFSYN